LFEIKHTRCEQRIYMLGIKLLLSTKCIYICELDIEWGTKEHYACNKCTWLYTFTPSYSLLHTWWTVVLLAFLLLIISLLVILNCLCLIVLLLRYRLIAQRQKHESRGKTEQHLNTSIIYRLFSLQQTLKKA